ncbi:hypothetical protein HMPREF9554_01253 [Treponema phagedenis F0421]|nr:hypothetical protein HMPREF9554_01253 [Treponema phagedenis F0421]
MISVQILIIQSSSGKNQRFYSIGIIKTGAGRKTALCIKIP